MSEQKNYAGFGYGSGLSKKHDPCGKSPGVSFARRKKVSIIFYGAKVRNFNMGDAEVAELELIRFPKI